MLSGFAGLVSAAADGVNDLDMITGFECDAVVLAARCNLAVELNGNAFASKFQFSNQC